MPTGLLSLPWQPRSNRQWTLPLESIVRVSNPDRVYFSDPGVTKLGVVNYYLSVGAGIVAALREQPCMLHRFPTGAAGEKVHQKRVPAGAPPWLRAAPSQ